MNGSLWTLCGAVTAPMLAVLFLLISLEQPAETYSWQVSSSLQPWKHYSRHSKPSLPPWKHYSQNSKPSVSPWKHYSQDSKPSVSPWKHYSQDTKPSVAPWKHYSQDTKPSVSPWKHYSQDSKPSVSPWKHYSQDTKPSVAPWKHYSQDTKPSVSPWKHYSQDSRPLFWPAKQSNMLQKRNTQLRGKSDARPFQNSLNRKSLKKRQFLIKSSSFAEQPSVDHARKVNDYFADSRWVNSISSTADIGRETLNIAAGLRTRQQSQQKAVNTIPPANRYQPSSSASSLQRNDLIYSSYSSYQPVEKQSSSAPLEAHHTNQGPMKKSFRKKVLPFVVVSLLVLGLSLGGMAYVFTLSPPTLVTYSKRRSSEAISPIFEGISLLAWTWLEAQQVWQDFGSTHSGFVSGECWPWLLCTALRNQRSGDHLPSSFSRVVALAQRLESFIVQTGLVTVVGTWRKHMPCKDDFFCRKRLIHSY